MTTILLMMMFLLTKMISITKMISMTKVTLVYLLLVSASLMVLRYSALAGWGRSRSSLRTFPVLLTTSSAPVFKVSDFVIEWREEEPDYGSALLDHQLLTGLSVVDDHSHLEQVG